MAAGMRLLGSAVSKHCAAGQFCGLCAEIGDGLTLERPQQAGLRTLPGEQISDAPTQLNRSLAPAVEKSSGIIHEFVPAILRHISRRSNLNHREGPRVKLGHATELDSPSPRARPGRH